MNHEIHEKREKNKMIFNRKLLDSHSQSPDWECTVIETFCCIPKVGFKNETKLFSLISCLSPAAAYPPAGGGDVW